VISVFLVALCVYLLWVVKRAELKLDFFQWMTMGIGVFSILALFIGSVFTVPFLYIPAVYILVRKSFLPFNPFFSVPT
jgi:hypothetical protein